MSQSDLVLYEFRYEAEHEQYAQWVHGKIRDSLKDERPHVAHDHVIFEAKKRISAKKGYNTHPSGCSLSQTVSPIAHCPLHPH